MKKKKKHLHVGRGRMSYLENTSKVTPYHPYINTTIMDILLIVVVQKKNYMCLKECNGSKDELFCKYLLGKCFNQHYYSIIFLVTFYLLKGERVQCTFTNIHMSGPLFLDVDRRRLSYFATGNCFPPF